jgi:integrase
VKLARPGFGPAAELPTCSQRDGVTAVLRVKDVDFERGQIHVRDPKGRRDRHTMLPQMSVPLLRHQLELARAIHDDDLRDGFGAAWLPDAIDRKIPSAPKAWEWQWIFRRPRGGKMRTVSSTAIISTTASSSGR